MTLRRFGCSGVCPEYSVTIRGDGRIRYEGRSGTLVTGVHEGSIPIDQVDRLIEHFGAAGFWSLDPVYEAQRGEGRITYELTFAAGSERKTVTDQFGLDAGMPDAVRALQAAVDEAAGTARWVHGTGDLLDSLAGKGFDFRSAAAAQLMVASIGRASDSVPLGLLDRGAPLDTPWNCHGCWESTAGEAALTAAVENGRLALFDRLATPAMLGRMEQLRRDELLLSAAKVRSPHLVQRLLAAGASMSASSYGGGSVLLHAVDDNGQWAEDADPAALVRLLLARGAKVEDRDGIGWTALQHAYDEEPEIARILLAAGADVDAHGGGGHPILYLTGNEEIALMALDAGADRTLKDMTGRTLGEIARAHGWNRVERLLAAAK